MSTGGQTFGGTYPGCALQPGSAERSSTWYALLTRARNERVVVQRLTERGFESYLPATVEVHTWKDRKKKVDVPLFSCYVFVKMDLKNEDRYRVCNIDGVFGFVGPRGEATPIPDDQIDAVRTLLNQRMTFSDHPFLKLGQRVRIRGGALNGVEGVFQARNGERTLIISIDAIQRSLAVRVEGYQVDPI
jgi:transcription antitermination factor NusG